MRGLVRTTAMVMVFFGTLYLSVGAVAFWVERTVFDPAHLASLSGDLLAREEISSALSGAMVDASLEDAPLVARFARPLLVPVVEGIVSSGEFAAVMRTSVELTATTALEGSGPEIVLVLPDALTRVRDGVAALDPALAADLPSAADLETTVITAGRAVSAARRADRALAPVSWVLLAVGLVLVVGGIAVTDRRRGAGILTGAFLALWMSLLAVALVAGGELMARSFAGADARAAAEAAWEVVFGEAQMLMLVVALSGVAAVALLWVLGGARERRLGSVALRAAAIAAAAAGVLLVVRPRRGADLLVVAAGLALLVFGLAWFVPASWRAPAVAPGSGAGDPWG